MKDPMARFSGDWENEFVPDYKSNLDKAPAESQEFDPENIEKPFGAGGVAPWDMVCDPSQQDPAPASPRPRTKTMPPPAGEVDGTESTFGLNVEKGLTPWEMIW